MRRHRPQLQPLESWVTTTNSYTQTVGASKQRYTDPHVGEPVHGGAGDLIAIERSDQLFFVDDNPNGEESLALLFCCVRRNELLCVADLVAQTRPAS